MEPTKKNLYIESVKNEKHFKILYFIELVLENKIFLLIETINGENFKLLALSF